MVQLFVFVKMTFYLIFYSIRENDAGLKKFEGKIVHVFLPIRFNMCFGCIKELSHSDGSFEYPQHMFWLRNKKLFFLFALLTKGLKEVCTQDFGSYHIYFQTRL